MGRDLAEQERAFIEGLSADTGRDLDSWMQAIAASGKGNRNDIIDWLRQQGFAFSKASWLERIHHNGGQLIYGDILLQDAPARPSVPLRSRPLAFPAPLPVEPSVEPATPEAPMPEASMPEASTPEPVKPEPLPQPPRAVVRPQQPAETASDEEVAGILQAAKGLRPLAVVLLREAEATVPGLTLKLAPPLLLLACPTPFAALLPGPKDLRLYADYGAGGRDRARKAGSGRIPPPFPDVLVLNDARQIDDRFRELLASAYLRALN